MRKSLLKAPRMIKIITILHTGTAQKKKFESREEVARRDEQTAMSGLMEQMRDESLPPGGRDVPGVRRRGRHRCTTRPAKNRNPPQKKLERVDGTHLEHEPEEEQHSNTRNNVCMVLDDELVAHHRRVLVALFPDAHVDAARSPPHAHNFFFSFSAFSECDRRSGRFDTTARRGRGDALRDPSRFL